MQTGSSIPGWGSKIPSALRPKNQNIKYKQYCNKFSRGFENEKKQTIEMISLKLSSLGLGLDEVPGMQKSQPQFSLEKSLLKI